MFTLTNKTPELKIAFPVHQNTRNILGGLCSIQVTETDTVFLFGNVIIYDALSALQFLLSLSLWLHSCFFFFFISYLLHYTSAVFIYLHICCFTESQFFSFIFSYSLFCPPETYIKNSNFLIFPLCLLSAELS